jgi:orotidine-5'-phosphate decarboxylase
MKLIVALDFATEREGLNLIEQLDPSRCALKIGSEMFTHLGVQFVKTLVNKGYKIFLDLKFYDIPNTVAQACKAAADLGVWMLDVHASGGMAMMEAARITLDTYGDHKPLLIAVTILTSMNIEDLKDFGLINSIETQVKRLAKLAHQSGLDGVVCAAQEVPLIKSLGTHPFLAITPGIRLSGDSVDDQSRITTPEKAIQLGSDYLVVGRSITRAINPGEVVSKILASTK